MDPLNNQNDLATESQADPQVDAETKKRLDEFKARIAACKEYKRKILPNWTDSVDHRRGKPFSSQSDEDRVVVNLDWALTKTKQAALFSQVPKIRIDHPPETLSLPWLAKFEQKLNDTLIVAGIDSAMEEVLPDVINAAGIGGILVSHEELFEAVDMPLQDPSIPLSGVEGIPGIPSPPISVPRRADHRYSLSRVSPDDILFPVNFDGSDFEKAPWLGRSGRITWAQGVQWLKLDEKDKKKILGDDRRPVDRVSYDSEKERPLSDEMVSFDELFYREHLYSTSGTKSFSLIHHLVFVNGKNDPVIDEAWKGQKINLDGSIVGCFKYPIQILTLTYISGEAIPPSDSAAGRPTVNEINKSRTQMIQQRERSLPIRWFDINRIDTALQTSLMRGQWQAMIPVQGDGSRSIGEIARAAFPNEDFAFYKIASENLNQIWSIGPNQEGTGEGVDTATEAGVIQSNFQTRIGRERAKVCKFLCSVGEILGGLLCQYEDPAYFGEGFDPTIGRALTYSILADSTVLLDSNQKLKKLMDFVNFNAKSGWVDVEPVLREIAQLSGLDPNIVIKAPQPKPPVEPTISLRLTGVEDLMNPLALAFLMKSGQAPPPQLVEEAKKIIESAIMPPLDSQMPGAGGLLPPVNMGGGGGGGPEGGSEGGPSGGSPAPAQAVGPIPSNPIIPPPLPHMALPPSHPPALGLAHPNWSLMPHVSKNADEK